MERTPLPAAPASTPVGATPDASNVVQLHRGVHFSDRERDFDEWLLAERDRLAEFDRKPDLFASFAANDQRAYDKPLVAFFRRWSGRIGVALYVLAVLVACLFVAELVR